MRENAGYIDRIKFAIQLSFIFWVIFSILIFYATFAAAARMWGTLMLLIMVVIFTPFLPEGASYEEIEN